VSVFLSNFFKFAAISLLVILSFRVSHLNSFKNSLKFFWKKATNTLAFTGNFLNKNMMNLHYFQARPWPVILTFIGVLLFFTTESLHSQPAGFSDNLYLSGWDEVAGFTWDANGRMYVWERKGKVWVVVNGVKQSTPLLDISEEVGGWRDFGLLGFALDPNFLSNGYIYLLYVVDRHHLLKFGTGQYNPSSNEYFAATIGRITRYKVDITNSYNSIVPNSRFILMGNSLNDGPPILHESHGTGSLAFGQDGTLLATMGDGASYNAVDQGSDPDTYWQQALNDGIITAAQNIGAYRCQTLHFLFR
jgi:hypothetical protein